MIVRTFSGPSLRDALRQVRENFGADAVILDTQFEQNGRNRVSGNVSVTAAHEAEPALLEPREGVHTLHLRGEIAEMETVSEVSADVAEEETRELAATDDPAPESERPLRSAAGEKRAARTRQPEPVVVVSDDPAWTEFRRWLSAQPQLTAGLIESFTTHLVESLPSPSPFLEGRLKGQVVLFVGGHGVGKSTAMFKALAARWQLRQRKPQLSVLTSAADSRPDWVSAICAECDVPYARHAIIGSRLPISRPRRGDDLFVEYTAASSPETLASQVRAIRRGLKPDAVVLVLHAGAAPAAWRAEYVRYASLSPTHVLFTHWDEFAPWWEMVAFLRSHLIAGSYRTAGHDPIGDILPLTATDLQTGIAEHLSHALDWAAPTGRAKGGSR